MRLPEKNKLSRHKVAKIFESMMSFPTKNCCASSQNTKETNKHLCNVY